MSQETPQQEVQMEVDARLDSTPAEGKEASDVTQQSPDSKQKVVSPHVSPITGAAVVNVTVLDESSSDCDSVKLVVPFRCETTVSDMESSVDSAEVSRIEEEKAVKVSERDNQHAAAPSHGVEPLQSKILDNVMLSVVGDVPESDPKTKLGRLKRQLEIKMAVPRETLMLDCAPPPKRSRLTPENQPGNGEKTIKSEEAGTTSNLDSCRESKLQTEIRIIKEKGDDEAALISPADTELPTAGTETEADSNGFPWKSYLNRVRGRSAPATYFNQWVAPLSNDFIENVLLEAVDQASGHERRVVLAKVADVIGIRLLLSLIGCPDTHPGQVVYVDSPDIHPIGWCRAQGKQLGIPVGVRKELLPNFEKFRNEQTEKAEWASPSFFTYAGQIKSRYLELPRVLIGNSSTFAAGERLEAIMDDKSPKRVRVANVKEVVGDTLIIHADGDPQEPRYYKQYPVGSRLLHPVGFCYSKNLRLVVPRGMIAETFNWADYLRSLNAKAASPLLFKKRNYFRVGMKLEAIDPKHPLLICLATITEVKDNQLKIHFDDCGPDRDFWVDADSRTIFPCGWCEKTKHPLETSSKFLGDVTKLPSTSSSKSGTAASSSDETLKSGSPAKARKVDVQASVANPKHDTKAGGFVKRNVQMGRETAPQGNTNFYLPTAVGSLHTQLAQEKTPIMTFVTGSNTARKSTSGRLSLPLNPQLAARQSRSKTTPAATVLTTAVLASPFRVPAVPPQRGPQLVAAPHRTNIGGLSATVYTYPSQPGAAEYLRMYFDISHRISTGSVIGRRKLMYLPAVVVASQYVQLTTRTLQTIMACCERPLAFLKAMPKGNNSPQAARIVLDQVGQDTVWTTLPPCDTEVGMFRLLHQTLDTVGCSRDFVSKTRRKDGDPVALFQDKFRVSTYDENHVAYVNNTVAPIGPVLSGNKLKRAVGLLSANTYPELAQNIAQFLVDKCKDPKVVFSIIPEARISTGKELYIFLPDGTKKAISHSTGFNAAWTMAHRIMQAIHCSPELLTPTKLQSSTEAIAPVSASSSATQTLSISRPITRQTTSTGGSTVGSGPVAYFNIAVETGPKIVRSLLFQLPKHVSAKTYTDLVRSVIQMVSSLAVTPRVVFECMEGGGDKGENFSLLWKDERGRLHTQFVAVEDSYDGAWRLIGRLLERLGCSSSFITPQAPGTAVAGGLEPADSGSERPSWYHAVFDISINTGPMLDVKKVERLPERTSAATVDLLHKRVIQMIVDCAMRPEQVFWLIPGGSCQAEVTCQTSGGDLLRRKIRSCASVDVLRRYVESFLINIRCSPKFVRIGNLVVKRVEKAKGITKIASKTEELHKQVTSPSSQITSEKPTKSPPAPSPPPPSSSSFPTSPASPLTAAEVASTNKAHAKEQAKVPESGAETTNPEQWSVSDVVSYFQSTPDCRDLAPLFEKNEIDGSALMLLDRDALVQFMGVKMGPTLKALQHVNKLKAKWKI